MIALTRNHTPVTISKPKRNLRVYRTHAEKLLLRDRAIHELRSKGWTTCEIGHAVGLTQRHVRNVINEIDEKLEELAGE